MARTLPAADVVVLGGGTAGAVIAGRLIERTSRTVAVLEAGPDFGPLNVGGWPEQFLDHRTFALSHDWDYVNSSTHAKRGMRLERAKVIGGCSSHNGCAAVWGFAGDYDAWEAAGNPGWGAAALLPLFGEANARMRVSTPSLGEIGPFHAASVDAALATGYSDLPDFNDLKGETGFSINPLNADGPIRWNAAFAYLDPVRDDPKLAIHDRLLVDRVVTEGGRAIAVEALDANGETARIEAGEIVVAAGTYGSPAILLRSGIGSPDDLRDLGVEVVSPLRGVGANLQDHPGMTIAFEATPDLREALHDFVAAGGSLRDEGITLRSRSSLATDPGYDTHLYPFGRDTSDSFSITPTCMVTRSRGAFRLIGRDPSWAPVIDTGFFTDQEGHDLAVVVEGVSLAREMARAGAFGRYLGLELGPASGVTGADLNPIVRAEAQHDYHPAGTCRMGPATDPTTVVDSEGRVHGVEGLRVADASIMPELPRVNTNIPVVVIGERIAQSMTA